MKTLNQYIQEKLNNKKNYRDNKIVVKSFEELRKIIEDRYDKLGPGTKQNPIDFNDIDTSNITSFDSLFNHLNFEYIDISLWDTSQVDSMKNMFYSCEKLVSIGDIGEWDVSNVKTFRGMFFDCVILKSIGDLTDLKVTDKLTDTTVMFCMCYKLKNIGDIGGWEMKNVSNTCQMFQRCDELEYIGDVSSWDLGNVKSMSGMFYGCKNLNDIGDLSKWKKPKGFRRNFYFEDIFKESSIKNIPDWAF